MAEFGAKHPCFKSAAKNSGVVLGKLVAANLTVTLASGELYADDALAEELSEFARGSLAMEVDNLDDDTATEIYGAEATEGEVTYNKDDTPPEGVLGYFKTLMVSGAKKYKAFIYPRAKAAIGNDDAQTRGSSITFQTAKPTFTIMADANGDWRKTQTFDTEAAAVTYVNTACGIT